MDTIRAAFFALCLLALAGTTGAETIRVPDDQPTIQAAIDVAENADTIVVGPGNFAGFTLANADLVDVVGEPGHLITGDAIVTGSISTRLIKLRVQGSIRIGTSSFSLVRKCRVFGGSIEILESDNDFVERNRVENPPEIGIFVEGDAEPFSIERNLIVAPGIVGIAVNGAGKLRGNKVEGGVSGISVGEADGRVRTIRNQIVDVVDVGIEIAGENHVLRGNEVLGAGDDGMVCLSGSGNRFEDNLIKRTNDGFDIKAGCSNNKLIGNRVKNVNADGIDLVSNGNLAKKNLVKGTAAVGIELNGTGNTVINNNIRNAGEQALREDIGGNMLSGNSCPGDADGCN